jgi:hypothetical protein
MNNFSYFITKLLYAIFQMYGHIRLILLVTHQDFTYRTNHKLMSITNLFSILIFDSLIS